MPKMLLSPVRLTALLEPLGFWLRDVNSVSKTIEFVRESTLPRLYEHLNIEGQGKQGEAVYATTAISASSSESSDECVSEEDLTLLSTLETDQDRHWTLIRNREEAEAWEKKLAPAADLQCRATAQALGPLLSERLQPAFSAVDRYIAKLGDLTDVFVSEFRFFQEAPAFPRNEAEELASQIGETGASSEDVELACLVLFLFAADVEGSADAFRDKSWEDDPILRSRIILLIESIREHRKRYRSSTA